MRYVSGVLLPLVTLQLLHGMLQRREKSLHALRNGIGVTRHVDDLTIEKKTAVSFSKPASMKLQSIPGFQSIQVSILLSHRRPGIALQMVSPVTDKTVQAASVHIEGI